MGKILFGAGEIGKGIVANNVLDDVSFFCDNNHSGEIVEGIRVLSFDELLSIYSDYEVILTVKNEGARDEIQRLLEANTIPYKDIFDIDEIKYAGELDYWKEVFKKQNGQFANNHYQNLMLSIAEEDNDDFLKGKIVADFGCGPRGSLQWMSSPAMKIGIDVLAQSYFENFGSSMLEHEMVYVTSTEKYIPLPTDSVDCLITINSLDHVRNLEIICLELLRILKTGGIFLASFNLNEPITECEPQTLTEGKLKDCLLKYFDVQTYRMAKKDETNGYENMFSEKYLEVSEDGTPTILWIRAVKR